MGNINKVLIIDDDMVTLSIIGRVLSKKGYEVHISATAVDIFSIVTRCAPDVILMDHYMPDFSGKETIKLLKSNELTKSIPIIYFSTYASLEVLSKNAGADAFVSKLSPIDDLMTSIESFAKE